MVKFLILLGALLAGPAWANCVCRCVNGENVPICSNPMTMPPMCPMAMCQMPSPSLAPIDTPRVPPVGTTSCSQQQVYNPATGRYEWRQICR